MMANWVDADQFNDGFSRSRNIYWNVAFQPVNLSCSSCSLLALMCRFVDHKARGECQERTVPLQATTSCGWSHYDHPRTVLVFQINLYDLESAYVSMLMYCSNTTTTSTSTTTTTTTNTTTTTPILLLLLQILLLLLQIPPPPPTLLLLLLQIPPPPPPPPPPILLILLVLLQIPPPPPTLLLLLLLLLLPALLLLLPLLLLQFLHHRHHLYRCLTVPSQATAPQGQYVCSKTQTNETPRGTRTTDPSAGDAEDRTCRRVRASLIAPKGITDQSGGPYRRHQIDRARTDCR